MSEWKEYILSDLMDIIGGGTPKTSIPEYWGGTIPWLSVVDFGNENKFVQKTEKNITELGLKNSSTKILSDGQIIISARGTVGELAVIKGNMAFNQSCYGLSAKELICNNNYLYYLLKCKIVELKRNAHGAVFDTITRTTFDTITAIVPDLPTQTAIAEILSSLDDKIELNNKINQELENLAQTLFKQWFIDFEFPNENGEPYKSSGGEMVDSEMGEIPEGWELDSLDNIAEFLNGLALQKFPPESDYEFLPVIKIRELRQKDTSNSDKASINIPEKYIVEDGDVLFSWSGSLMIDFWTSGKGALNQHLFKVTSKEYPKWYYYLWTKHHLTEFIEIAESKATTMGHIQRQHLTNAKVVIPNENTIINFSLVFEPIISKIIDNRVECGELIKLRNTLLPKLISGELEINEIAR